MESAPGEPEHDELIGYQVGAYHIVELVARGGMGRVYRAHQPALQRYVAIKTLLLEHLDLESTGADFQREAELDHNVDGAPSGGRRSGCHGSPLVFRRLATLAGAVDGRGAGAACRWRLWR